MGLFPRSCLSTTRYISNPETASLFLVKLTRPQYVDSKSSDRTSLVNPYDGSSIPRQVHVAGKDDVDTAVSAALKAYKGEWSTYSPAQRQTCMLRFADLVERNAEQLAALESLPTGRPVTPTMQFDIAHMAQVYRCMRLSWQIVSFRIPSLTSTQTTPDGLTKSAASRTLRIMGSIRSSAMSPWAYVLELPRGTRPFCISDGKSPRLLRPGTV